MNIYEVLDKARQKHLWEFLCNPNETCLVLYDMPHVEPKCKRVSTQAESTEQYIDYVCKFFDTYHLQLCSEDTIQKALAAHSRMLYEAYLEKLQTIEDNDEERNKLIEHWFIYTKLILEETFANRHHAPTNNGELISTWQLFREVISELDGAYAAYLRNQAKKKWPSLEMLVSYNLWDKEFYKKFSCENQSSAWQGSADRARHDFVFNEEYFIMHCIHYINEIDGTKPGEETNIIGFIEKLFCDYTYRIRVIGKYSSDQLIYAAKYWKITTEHLLNQIFGAYIYNTIINHMPPEHGDMRYDCPMNAEAGRLVRQLKNVHEKCKGFMTATCTSYIEKIESGWLSHSWDEELQEIGIDYKALYVNMKGVYITDAISFNQFTDAFKSADFKVLYNNAEIKKARGVILFVVNRLGERVTDEWRHAACSSLYPSSSDPVREVQKNAKPGAKKEDIEDLLITHIKVFHKKRSK